MARIFISHSSLDDVAAAQIKTWLDSQGFENAFLDKDKTTGIPPGADWEKTLYREVEQSQAAEMQHHLGHPAREEDAHRWMADRPIRQRIHKAWNLAIHFGPLIH